MKHTFTDKLVMLAELTIKPDRINEFLEYTVENLKVSRSYPGNIEFDILVDANQPDKIFFYEVWESADHQQAYMAWRIAAGDLTKLLSLLADAPKFTSLHKVAAPDEAAG